MSELQDFMLNVELSTKKILREQNKKNIKKKQKNGKSRIESSSNTKESHDENIKGVNKKKDLLRDTNLPSVRKSDNASPRNKDNITPLDENHQLPLIRSKKNITKEKLLRSPLYQSLKRSRSEQLKGNEKSIDFLKYIGSIGEHVDKRMCSSCWSNPEKLNSCERGCHRYLEKTKKKTDLKIPMSWSSKDLRLKYRGEKEREDEWKEYQLLKLEHKEEYQIPLVTRHPIYELLLTLIDKENLRYKKFSHKCNSLRVYFNDPSKELSLCYNNTELYKREEDLNIDKDYKSIYQPVYKAKNPPLNNLRNTIDAKELYTNFSFYEKYDPKENIPVLSLELSGMKENLNKILGVICLKPRRKLLLPKNCQVNESSVPVAIFYRDKSRSSHQPILVNILYAIDAPISSDYITVWEPESISSLIEKYEEIIEFPLEQIIPPPTSLLNFPLVTEIEQDKLPSTIYIIRNNCDEENSFVKDETKIPFCQTLSIPLSIFPQELSTNPFGISPAAASPNKVGTYGKFIWHSDEVCSEELNKRKTPKDYCYILERNSTVGPNEKILYTALMRHETLWKITFQALNVYVAKEDEEKRQKKILQEKEDLEKKIRIGRELIEAKRAEKERIEKQIRLNASSTELRMNGMEINTNLLQLEWEERVRNSRLIYQWNEWEERQDNATLTHFYHCLNEDVEERDQWNAPSGWNYANENALKTEELMEEKNNKETNYSELTNQLIEDEYFLSILKRKLGIKKKQEESSDEEESDEEENKDKGQEEQYSSDKLDKELAILRLDMTQNGFLDINKVKAIESKTQAIRQWRKLKSTSIPYGFSKKVSTSRIERPKQAFFNTGNRASFVGIVKPLKSLYEQTTFIPKLTTTFISNIKNSLSNGVDDEEKKKERKEEDIKIQNEEKAFLYARTNNLKELEMILDENVDINARDANGNTLFIVGCQQGNKRTVKLVLSRGGNPDLQNSNGNTGLHYCYEYKNIELAEYLIKKGAKDSIVNLDGTTCYEGLSKENLE